MASTTPALNLGSKEESKIHVLVSKAEKLAQDIALELSRRHGAASGRKQRLLYADQKS